MCCSTRNDPAAAEGERPREKWSFRRSNYFQFVGAECRNVHENVGLQDMSAFAKLEVSGPGAESWLNSILTNRIPKAIGRVTLTYLLTARGGVRAEFTLTRIGPERFYLVSAGALESHDFDSLEKLLPGDGSVRLDRVIDAARRSRARRPAVARGSGQGRRYRRFERGVPMADRAAPFDRVGGPHRHAGEFRRRARLRAAPSDRDAERDLRRAHVGRAPFGIKPFGIRAMDSLRLEKSYKLVGRELSIEYAALEIRPRSVRRFQERLVPRPRRADRLGRQGRCEQASRARS